MSHNKSLNFCDVSCLHSHIEMKIILFCWIETDFWMFFSLPFVWVHSSPLFDTLFLMKPVERVFCAIIGYEHRLLFFQNEIIKIYLKSFHRRIIITMNSLWRKGKEPGPGACRQIEVEKLQQQQQTKKTERERTKEQRGKKIIY